MVHTNILSALWQWSQCIAAHLWALFQDNESSKPEEIRQQRNKCSLLHSFFTSEEDRRQDIRLLHNDWGLKSVASDHFKLLSDRTNHNHLILNSKVQEHGNGTWVTWSQVRERIIFHCTKLTLDGWPLYIMDPLPLKQHLIIDPFTLLTLCPENSLWMDEMTLHCL